MIVVVIGLVRMLLGGAWIVRGCHRYLERLGGLGVNRRLESFWRVLRFKQNDIMSSETEISVDDLIFRTKNEVMDEFFDLGPSLVSNIRGKIMDDEYMSGMLEMAAARLWSGFDEFGFDAFTRSKDELFGEVDEELADTLAWNYFIHSRLLGDGGDE